MIAAIYARKSTEQNVADDAKNVKLQVANARAFATARGWAVSDDHIYEDDGISGAEFERRPGFVALMDALRPKPIFNVLILAEESRLGRNTTEVPYAIAKLVKAGVEVWCYRDGRRVSLDTPMDKFMVSATSFASDMERWLSTQRTSEKMLAKAKAGHVTGGRVFGYDHVRVPAGHVERRINEDEAKVVRDIYQRYADGAGFKDIAHELNARGAKSPRSQRGRPAGWEPSTVRAVLRREIYRGVVIYNRTKKRDTDGSRHRGRQPKRPESEWVRLEMPEVRLIDAKLADEVDARLDVRRTAYLRTTAGKLLGRPATGNRLLSGYLVCECGARFEAVKNWGWRKGHSYVCAARRRKGPSVCNSEISFGVAEIERVFLDVIEGQVLHPDFIDRVVEGVFAESPDAQRDALTAERARLRTEVTNLTAAIAAGGDLNALVGALKDRDRKLREIEAQLAKPVALPEREALHAALTLRGKEWREVLRGKHVAQARTVLAHLIDLPIRITNQPMPPYIQRGDTRGTENIKWTAKTRPDGILVGLVRRMASPTGFEPVFQP